MRCYLEVYGIFLEDDVPFQWKENSEGRATLIYSENQTQTLWARFSSFKESLQCHGRAGGFPPPAPHIRVTLSVLAFPGLSQRPKELQRGHLNSGEVPTIHDPYQPLVTPKSCRASDCSVVRLSNFLIRIAFGNRAILTPPWRRNIKHDSATDSGNRHGFHNIPINY